MDQGVYIIPVPRAEITLRIAKLKKIVIYLYINYFLNNIFYHQATTSSHPYNSHKMGSLMAIMSVSVLSHDIEYKILKLNTIRVNK